MRCGKARRDGQQPGRRYRREQRRAANRPLGDDPLDHRRAHRMADEDRRRVQRARDMLDVGFVVVEPGDEQRIAAAARAMAAQAQCVSGIALRGEPREKIRLPEPRVAIAAVDEEQRRLPRCRSLATACGLRGALQAVALRTRDDDVSRREKARHCARRRHPASPMYDASCRRCVRLATFLDEVRAAHPTYRCLPVPPFGDPDARLVIVGLAPGLHGANATGRAVHRRFRGHPAVRNAARLRLRFVAAVAHRR